MPRRRHRWHYFTMTVRKVLGGAGKTVLECDGCGATSRPHASDAAWAVSGDERHACPTCTAEDALFLPGMGLRQWLSRDDIEYLFRNEATMDRVRVSRWLTSAEKRRQIIRSEGLPRTYQRAVELP